MDSWNLIGWLLLGSVALLVLRRSLAVVWRWGVFKVAHLRTRNVPPAPWQEWMQRTPMGWRKIRVQRILDNGRIVLESGSARLGTTWSDSPEEWKQRVRNRSCFLLGTASRISYMRPPRTPRPDEKGGE